MPGFFIPQQIYQMCIKTAAMATDEIFTNREMTLFSKNSDYKTTLEAEEWISDPLPAIQELHPCPLR